MEELDDLLRGWVRDGLVPGGVCCIRMNRKMRYLGAFGEYRDNKTVEPVEPGTLFDLASLTKVAATLPVVLSLVHEGKLGWNDPVSRYVDIFMHKNVKIIHLLNHMSGLPADLPPCLRHAPGIDVLQRICASPLTAAPGSRTLYSDLGMILLGEAAANAAGEPLEELAESRVFGPLGMNDTGYAVKLANVEERAAATEMVDGRYIVGEVHDEKTWHMGGVSGSAGLFGTAEDLARYADLWLYPRHQSLVPPELLRASLIPTDGGRGLGWEIRRNDYVPPSCGLSWPPGSFGHTGFTGTSIWCNPHTGMAVVWLTNAVHDGRDMPVRELRRVLHDRIASLPGL